MYVNCYYVIFEILLKNYLKFEIYKFFIWYNVIKFWNNKFEVYFVYRILFL